MTQIILRIGYETQTEEEGCIELAMSLAQLKQLSEKAEKARTKIEVLRKSIQDWMPGGLADSTD